MRLNKYLALCGLGSRRGVEALIDEGRITLDGQVVWEQGTQVEEGQMVAFDGAPVVPPQSYSLWIFNKPKGYLCTKDDPQGRQTVYSLLPEPLKNLHYVGRLDLHSRGLLFFTDDGELSRRLTLPEYRIPRKYRVELNESLSPYHASMIRQGLEIDDGTRFRPAKVKVKERHVELELTEGKNREIRRMVEFLGYKVRDLRRMEYGGIALGSLEEGKIREATPAELEHLYKAVQF